MGATPKTDPSLVRLLAELKELSRTQDAPIWREVARRLQGPNRNRPEVNLSRVVRAARDGETVLVPGVLLASGTVTKPLTIAAYRASAGAKAKVSDAGGKVLTLQELAAANPKGSNVRIVG